MKNYFKKFNFGKVDFNRTGRKVNKCELDCELRDEGGIYELSICGEVWNSKNTDIIAGGQCLDSMLPFLKNNGLFTELYSLWKKYHLNCMHAGTVKQENAIAEFRKSDNLGADYDDDCEYLKRRNLLEDTITDEDIWIGHETGESFRYGTAWLKRRIPENDLNRIKELLK